MCVWGDGLYRKGLKKQARQGTHKKIWNGPACGFGAPCFLPPWIPAPTAFPRLLHTLLQPQPAPLSINMHPTIHCGLFSPPSPDGLSGDPEAPGCGQLPVLMSCAHMDTQTSGAAMCCSGQASLASQSGAPGRRGACPASEGG